MRVGESNKWHGCDYGWKLMLNKYILVQTDVSFKCYTSYFQNMPQITELRAQDDGLPQLHATARRKVATL